jgi:hypothetical protein
MQAFNAGVSELSESLKPVKESVVSILQLQTDNEQHESRASVELEKVSQFSDEDLEHYPAPSTPQLKQVERLLDDGDCQEQTNCSTEKESGEHDGESKFVETTCENMNAESTPQQRKSEVTPVQKEAEEFANASKCGSVVSPHPQNEKVFNNSESNTTSANKVGVRSHKCEIKSNRKKMKVSCCVTIHFSHHFPVPLTVFPSPFWYFGLR